MNSTDSRTGRAADLIRLRLVSALITSPREALPQALATELDSYQAALGAAPSADGGGSQAVAGRTIQSGLAARAVAVG